MHDIFTDCANNVLDCVGLRVGIIPKGGKADDNMDDYPVVDVHTHLSDAEFDKVSESYFFLIIILNIWDV